MLTNEVKGDLPRCTETRYSREVAINLHVRLLSDMVMKIQGMEATVPSKPEINSGEKSTNPAKPMFLRTRNQTLSHGNACDNI